MKIEESRCPACDHPFDPRTRTRTLKLFKQIYLSPAQSEMLVLACCSRCRVEYEVCAYSQKSRRDGPMLTPFVIAVVGVTLLLSLVDIYLSLKLAAAGFQEQNPLLRFYHQFGPGPFVLLEYSLTSAAMFFFLRLQKRSLLGGWLNGRHLLLLAPITVGLFVLNQLRLLL